MASATLRLRLLAKKTPLLFYPIAAAKSDAGRRVVTPSTDIVIEGIARSGNTFAVAAFRSAQSGPVRIAHHFHAASQILLGLRWGIPVVVLIRNPRDAVVSHLVYDPSLSPEVCLREYISLYSRLLPHRDEFVVSPFEEVTSDFGAAVDRVNERYGTSFARFVPTPENTRAAFELVEESARRVGHGVRQSGRPREDRAPLKRKARARLESADVDRELGRAEALWRDFTGDGDGR